VKINRKVFYAANALVGFLFLGLIYAWSVFVEPLEEHFGWTRSQTSLNFSICMAMFCLGGLAAGKLAKKRAPRQIMVLSAIFILVGFILTSRMQTLFELYFFHGILCGFGVGTGYNALLSTTLQWFPDRQGMMSGLLLMGFGFGGSLLGSVAVAMMAAVGWSDTFMILGVALSCLILLVALNVKRPPAREPLQGNRALSVGKEYETGEMLRDASFYAYYARGLMLGAVGLALLGNAAPFASSISRNATLAASIGGLVSIFNGLGRVAGGFLFDKIGSRKTLTLGVGGTLLGTLLLGLAAIKGSVVLLIVGYVGGGFFYGCNIACSSSFIGKVYGLRNFAMNFSILYTYILFSSFLGPYISGVLFAWKGSYVFSYAVLLGMCCLAMVFNLCVKKHYVPDASVLHSREKS
jgi:OFA family oxalate/formate antiporter-like MFS transporter